MARKLPPKSLSSTTPPLRLTYGQRAELALEVRDACLSLARRHGVERVVCDTSVLDATVGGFLIWVTAWSHEVTGLDVWCPAMGGAKLLDLLWVVGDKELEAV